jgi:hypothetical protein
MSKIEVDQITQQSGTTLTVGGGACKTANIDATTITIGKSGGTVSLASGATQSGFGRSGSVDWQTGSIKTGDFTATSGEGYFVNTTSGEVTATLPSSPSAGDIVAFSDYTRTFATNKLTIGRNSQPIGGVSENATLNVNGQAMTLVYVDGTEGWINVQNAEDTETGTVPAYITATGGTITTVCTNYKVHTFTGPGTFEITAGAGPLSKLDYMVIAGAGGGGGGVPGFWAGGGGGAGGFRESKTAAVSGCWTASPLVAACGSLGPFSATSIPVTIGAGGAGGGGSGSHTCAPPARNDGGAGSNSIFSTITSAGGGKGAKSGSAPAAGPNGYPGGSGGGAGGYASPTAGGTGNTPPVSPPQGQPGGTGSGATDATGGGGGGAGGAGGNNAPPYGGGAGGTGVTTHINGSPVTYASGGPAGTNPSSSAPDEPANTGKGGKGGSNGPSVDGGNGSSGIVIIRYRFQ